jgi:hypothetical protein
MINFLEWAQVLGMTAATLILGFGLRRNITTAPTDNGGWAVVLLYIVAWPITLGHFLVGAIEEIRRGDS